MGRYLCCSPSKKEKRVFFRGSLPLPWNTLTTPTSMNPAAYCLRGFAVRVPFFLGYSCAMMSTTASYRGSSKSPPNIKQQQPVALRHHGFHTWAQPVPRDAISPLLLRQPVVGSSDFAEPMRACTSMHVPTLSRVSWATYRLNPLIDR